MGVMEMNCCVSGIEGSLKIKIFNCYLDTKIAFWFQYYTGNIQSPSNIVHVSLPAELLITY